MMSAAMGQSRDWDHFLPLRRTELIELIERDLGTSVGEMSVFHQVCDLIAACYHFEFNRRVQTLRTAYDPFDPDTDDTPLWRLSAQERQDRLNGFYRDLGWLLDRAQYTHLGRDEIEPIVATASDWGIRMDVDFSAFEHIALFARGDAHQRRTRRRLRNLYFLEETEVPIYRRLVLVLKLREHKRFRGKVDTEHVFLKVFKDIPKLDVMMLLPGAKVRLTVLDKGMIGMPLLSGALIAAYTFIQNVAEWLATIFLSSNAVWGLAAGGIGYGYKSYYGYQTTKQSYHLMLTQSLYFQNLDSNAGVLTRLLDEAEEQEGRSAILAYYCLWRHAGPDGWTSAELDLAMELFLHVFADMPCNCEKEDALSKLRRLHLAEPVEGARFRAVPPERALELLQATWNAYFTHAPAANRPLSRW
jgi:hypothetical protein